MCWDYGLDPVTSSLEKWDEQMRLLHRTHNDLGRLCNPSLLTTESTARLIWLPLARSNGTEMVEKWMDRFWKTVIPDDEYHWSSNQHDSHGVIIPVAIEPTFHAKSRS
jgi:hypothetical protein